MCVCKIFIQKLSCAVKKKKSMRLCFSTSTSSSSAFHHHHRKSNFRRTQKTSSTIVASSESSSKMEKEVSSGHASRVHDSNVRLFGLQRDDAYFPGSVRRDAPIHAHAFWQPVLDSRVRLAVFCSHRCKSRESEKSFRRDKWKEGKLCLQVVALKAITER